MSADALDEDGLELLAALLVDAGRGDEAVDRLAKRPRVMASTDLLARLARTLHGKGRPELAARLLDAARPVGPDRETTLAALTQAEVDAGFAERALARLVDRRQRGELPPDLRPTLVELAVFCGELDTAWSTGEDAGWPSLPPATLARLVAVAHANGRTAEVQALLKQVGDGVLESLPVLAAQLALDRGDDAGAGRWVVAADAGGAVRPDEQPALADVERRVGRASAAYARLRRHLGQGPVTPWALDLFAQVALDTRQYADAAPVLDRLRTSNGLAADLGWARVATAAGEAHAVLAWLESPRGRQAPVQALRDIAYLALDRRQFDLALAAASRLPSAAGREDRLLLARALTAAGRPEGALDVLRPLAARDRDASAMYDVALLQASGRNAKARDELTLRAVAELNGPSVTSDRRAELARRLIAAGASEQAMSAMEPLVRAQEAAWLPVYVDTAKQSRRKDAAAGFLGRRLQGRDLTPSSREAHVRALLDLGATATVEPHLQDLARRQGGAWVFAYDEALMAAGKRAGRVELWRERGVSPALSDDDRRAAAFKLLDLRDKPGAEQVLRGMAALEPPNGPSVAQLLHLWGPRPPEPAMEWLAARARASRGADRAGWMNHLTNAGGARRAAAVFTTPPPADETAVFDAWMNALRATRDRDRLATAIEQAAATSRDTKQLASLGALALAESLPAAAIRSYEALVAIDPGSLDARRWLGLLAMAAGDVVGAKEHLEHYVAAGGRDPEALLRYGELLERDGRRDAARRAYALGLQASQHGDRSTPAARRTHAFLLAHAGRAGDAQHDLEVLVAEQPADAHLRADYAAWLLKEGRRADAKRILGLR
jgi:tetratricopeptide (TPR) repeat protein